MKKIITLAILLSTAHTQCMKPEEKAVAVALFAAVAGYAIYDNCIKDPNVKLEEKYSRRIHSSNYNLEHGMMLHQQEVTEKNKVKTYLNSLPQLNEAQRKLLASL